MVPEINCGAVTVRDEEPLMLPSVAIMLAFPALWLAAKPPLATVAKLPLLEVQVAVNVRSEWVPSE